MSNLYQRHILLILNVFSKIRPHVHSQNIKFSYSRFPLVIKSSEVILFSKVRISITNLTLNYTMISLFCFLPASDGAYEVFQPNSRQLGLRWRKLWPETIRFKLSDNHIFFSTSHSCLKLVQNILRNRDVYCLECWEYNSGIYILQVIFYEIDSLQISSIQLKCDECYLLCMYMKLFLYKIGKSDDN